MKPAPRLKVALVGVNTPGYRSLALGYLRAYAQHDRRLSDVGFVTLDLDTSVDPWWIAWRVLGLEPDVLALSVVCWNARMVFEVARIVKQARPETVVIVGGPEVGPIAEEVVDRESALDAVVRGEGEVTFAECLLAIVKGRDLSRVDGVTARRNGVVRSAPDRPLVENLDDLPSPYLSGVLSAVDGATYLESYRGCPHRCSYCFEGKGYGRVRRFSPERIAAEIAHVANEPAVSSFSFIDPVFNLTPEHLRGMADLLEPVTARGVRLHTVEVDIERVDALQAAELARAGVASVETGPQSVGVAALTACRRSFDPEAFARGVRACRDAGISVETDLIIGLPGDTPGDVVAGLDFAIGLDPGIVQVSTLHVLPGTELWQNAEEYDLRFDPLPAHEVISTPEIGYEQLRRLEVLGTAAVGAYTARR